MIAPMMSKNTSEHSIVKMALVIEEFIFGINLSLKYKHQLPIALPLGYFYTTYLSFIHCINLSFYAIYT